MAGRHYPRSTGDVHAWFSTDGDGLDYLEWLRWPDGCVCPDCGHVEGWRHADGRWKCPACGRRTSVTAGTLFDRTRTPPDGVVLSLLAAGDPQDGISALSVKRTLAIDSYQTAWAMPQRLPVGLARPGRDRLTAEVEVDETYFGGEEPEVAGGRARAKKVLGGVAVEHREPTGFGRCRMAPLADAGLVTVRAFLTEHVTPGTTVITDGWSGYHGIAELGYAHELRNQRAAQARGEDVAALLPEVHRVAALAERLPLGTHQGSGDPAPLAGYLNQYVFRFNLRGSRSRGPVFSRVLEIAISHEPVRYRALTVATRPGSRWPRPPPPAAARGASNRQQPDAPGEPDSPASWILYMPSICRQAGPPGTVQRRQLYS